MSTTRISTTLERAVNYYGNCAKPNKHAITDVQSAIEALDSLILLAKTIGNNALNLLNIPLCYNADGHSVVSLTNAGLTKLQEQYDNPEVKLLSLMALMHRLLITLRNMHIKGATDFLLVSAHIIEDGEQTDVLTKVGHHEINEALELVMGTYATWESSCKNGKPDIALITAAQACTDTLISKLKKSVPYNNGSLQNQQPDAHIANLSVEPTTGNPIIHIQHVFNKKQKTHPVINKINECINEIEEQSRRIHGFTMD